MRLAKAILLRFLFGLLSLLFISFVAFMADEIAPGDQATVMAGEKATQERVMELRERLGLNDPVLIRYGRFLNNLAHLDFGNSYYGTKEPVIDRIKQTLPMTLMLAVIAILLSAVIGIALGTLAAVYENRAADRSVLILSTIGVTLPNFVLGPLLVIVFSLWLDRLPQNWELNRVGSDFEYLILPVIVLAARPMALLTRLTRASMVETMKQEFIRTAIAKGVRPLTLIIKHALRNAILPVITAIGTTFGFLLTGSFVVERFFTIPGLGSTAIEAIRSGDAPVVQATVLIAGLMFITVNLIVDILLPILDPRIRESQV
ncbi:MAG: ABC transporter permease [Fimbriimonadaceae bacterium]|nr:ABC transporter permease [Fimbriimonadaceae bacterium]